jgi:EAL domain-containing protein (putative c-di-GMP-specific phosphodiesterase class I)
MFQVRSRQDGQLISPSVFLPLAERVGMMPKIDLWVIHRLLRHLQGLKNLRAPIAFNVNLSNMTLAEPESLGLIAAAIKDSGVAAHQLIFEITETSELTSLHDARRFISELKKLGCRFALDDFGTGFSSFTHLRHLPVDLSRSKGGFVEHGQQRARPQDGQLNPRIGTIAQTARDHEHVDVSATLAAPGPAGEIP